MTEELTPDVDLSDLRGAIEQHDALRAGELIEALGPVGAVRDFTRLHDHEQDQLAQLLPEDVTAPLLESLPEPERKEFLERLSVEAAARIVSCLPHDEQADLISQLSDTDAEAILDELPDESAQRTRELIKYEPDSAGGLAVTEYLSYVDGATVGDVIEDMRNHAEEYRTYDVQYAFVTDDKKVLRGVLRLRDLLLASRSQPISRIMIESPLSVSVNDNLEQLEQFFERHTFFGVPAVDEEQRLVGVVRHQDVEEALSERDSKSFLKLMGIVGGEEVRTMPLRIRSMRRLAWLSINIGLNVLGASVIAVNQDTLSAVIALAVFLPIISDMSGCSGNQAVAVSMRELSLGLVRPSEFLRVLFKEGTLGLANGIALGLFLGLLAFLWKGSLILAVVVGLSLALNTILAVCVGGTIPLLLRLFRQDPALASGPILTTLTDMCGFFLVLTLARLTLPALTASLS